MRTRLMIFASLMMVLLGVSPVKAQTAKNATDEILKVSDITPKLFPETVFFRGLVAPTQMRNTGGVHFAGDAYFLAGLVDSSGYSTGVKQKYQGYILTEVPLEIGGQRVSAGAYGFGFVEGGKFLLMDLGAHDLFRVDSRKDTEMKHPVPLQVIAGTAPGVYLLYSGRDNVEVKRAK